MHVCMCVCMYVCEHTHVKVIAYFQNGDKAGSVTFIQSPQSKTHPTYVRLDSHTCVYDAIYIHTHVYTRLSKLLQSNAHCTSNNIHWRACAYIHTHVYEAIYMRLHSHTCLYEAIYMRLHSHTCVYEAIYIRLHSHTCVYEAIYMRLHSHTRTFAGGS